MKLFCHIQLKSLNEISFTGSLNSLFSASDYLIFEADNHSDGLVMEQGKLLIEQAKEVLIHIECTENAPLGQLNLLMEALRKSKSPTTYQLDGKHDQLEKMLTLIRSEKVDVLADQLSSNPSASK